MSTGKLVVVRHGESTWNATGKWTGITDVDLDAEGYHEGELEGEKLRDIQFAYAYTSEQVRTVEMLNAILKTQGQTTLTYERRWAVNERDYGTYTGLNKWEVEKQIGEEQFEQVRRSWDYPVPGGETLKDVYDRAVPFYLNEVLPRLKKGENILLVGHGNSIRALEKYIENISDQDISKVEMLFGTILVYDVDGQGRMVNKEERKIIMTPPPA